MLDPVDPNFFGLVIHAVENTPIAYPSAIARRVNVLELARSWRARILFQVE